MQCSRCGQENPPEAKFCGKCGAPMSQVPPPVRPEPIPAPPPTGKKLVYPKNPPLSPHLAWLNLIIPGLSQILMGQNAKGITLLLSSYLLAWAGIGVLIWIAAVIDGFMVGQVLQRGQPVGEWQFFPS
jgi:TM2 domain-containing membrane protein YozV